MQNFREQARKNGVTLIDTGPCQFCGAAVTGGVEACLLLASAGETGDHAALQQSGTLFLAVDAHALQHAEIHGPWNNALHLLRQHLMLERQIAWRYEKTPVLSDFLKDYRQRPTAEIPASPPPGQRGALTTADVARAATPDEHRALVRLWAEAVYAAFVLYHPWARERATEIAGNPRYRRVFG